MALNMEVYGPLIKIRDQQIDGYRAQHNIGHDPNRSSESDPDWQYKCQSCDAQGKDDQKNQHIHWIILALDDFLAALVRLIQMPILCQVEDGFDFADNLLIRARFLSGDVAYAWWLILLVC
jgi:hypothetical protein